MVAMKRIVTAAEEGHWIVLNNCHLMPRWLPVLQKKLEEISADSNTNEDFRIMLSSDPSNDIPVGVLDRSIKLIF